MSASDSENGHKTDGTSTNIRITELEKLMEERIQRCMDNIHYVEKTVVAGFSAMEKQNNLTQAASEKAIDKAQKAQDAYDSHHNDLVQDRVSNSTFYTKIQDMEAKGDKQAEAISEMSKIIASMGGGSQRGLNDQTRQQWVVATIVGAVAIMFSTGIGCIGLLLTLYLNFIAR